MVSFHKLLIIQFLFLIFQNYGDSIPVLYFPGDPTNSPSISIPPGWSHIILNKKRPPTVYKMLRINNRASVQATAQSSASALKRKITVNIKRYPIIEWSWKITGIFKQGNVINKRGNDYPAALCIKFPSEKPKNLREKVTEKIVKTATGDKPPAAGLDYIWASNTPKGTVVPSPYTNKLKLFIIESGLAKANKWVMERRHIYQDYKRAFGKEPDSIITAVIIMTDSDNTQDTTVSFYGAITFKEQ